MYWTRLGTILNAEIKLGRRERKDSDPLENENNEWLTGRRLLVKKSFKALGHHLRGAAEAWKTSNKNYIRTRLLFLRRGLLLRIITCSVVILIPLRTRVLASRRADGRLLQLHVPSSSSAASAAAATKRRRYEAVVVLGILCRLNLWPEKLISAKWSTRDDHHYNRTFHSAGMVNPTCWAVKLTRDY